jgi:hypothetical protein
MQHGLVEVKQEFVNANDVVAPSSFGFQASGAQPPSTSPIDGTEAPEPAVKLLNCSERLAELLFDEFKRAEAAIPNGVDSPHDGSPDLPQKKTKESLLDVRCIPFSLIGSSLSTISGS